MTGRTGAEILAATLARAGATRAFGMPGGEVLALVEALEAAGIGFVLARHENAAGFMAEGHWHATGSLPVLVATLGPGLANAVNVIANAGQDRVPLIVITGCVDAEMAASYTHQIFDHQAVLRPLVKASLRIEAGAVGATAARAIAIARDGQPGPVHLDLPIGVAEGAADEPLAAVPAPADRAPAPEAGIAAAAEQLAAARRPLAIIGLDAVNQNAGTAVAAFCRATGIPAITTYKAKGLIPEHDPLAIAAAGLSPKADTILKPLVDAADVLLLIGYDPIEMRAGWRHPWAADRTVIEITPVPRNHGMHPVTHTLFGGIAATLEELAPRAGTAPRWRFGRANAARTAIEAAFAPGATGPGAFFARLGALAPPEAVLTADSGAHRILLSQMWRCPAPRTLIQSSGLCTMACALPLAAGLKLGAPETPVIAVMGDAGLEMGLGELATLRDHALPIVIVVLVDGSLALIEMKQRASGYRNAGVDFQVSDLPGVARALGGHGAWIETPDDLDRELPAALARDRFSLLACRIARRAYDGTF